MSTIRGTTAGTARARRVALVLALCLGGASVQGQEPLTLGGVVVDGQRLALPGSTVVVRSEDDRVVATAVADRQGRFSIDGLVPAAYVLSVRLLGFAPFEQSLTLSQSRSDLEIVLALGVFEQQVTVTASLPEVVLESIVPGENLDRRAAQDVAGYLRNEPGVGAVRRGSINLEPSVRGLYEAQMGVFVDGTRTFAAGPARMDSEISHVSPHMLQSIEIVKGPYALAWGSGTLSSVRATTFRPVFGGSTFETHGGGNFNLGHNAGSVDGFGGLWGSNDRIRFSLLHNTRVGGDYTDGGGRTVPGDYSSYDTRWDVGFRATPSVRLEYAGGVQAQRDLDYPGRILDATLFDTYSHSAEVSYRPADSPVSEVFGQVYANLKNHRMNNEDKPTARPMPGRIPPFGLRIDLPTSSDTVGGRFFVDFQRNAWEVKAGFDVYDVKQSATRSIFRRDTNVLLFEDTVWPDAELTNVGGFGQIVREYGRSRIGGTLRVDRFTTSSGQTSEFFQANTTGTGDYEESMVSAAINASVRASDTWTLTLGAGRAVRPPDALERYSDRFPAAQFQVAAEFLGDPGLTAERSLEFNAGSVFQVNRVTVRADVFHRTIDNYITVEPDPTSRKRLPLSPDTVYRYINGSEARFVGFELSGQAPAGDWVGLSAALNYLRADDTLFDEPVFGITPFQQRYAVEVHARGRQRWIELSLIHAAEQDRVAVARLERPTEGWFRADLRGGYALRQNLALRGGIENVTDADYADHLNALNPFTGERVAEMGINGYVGLEVTF